MHQALQPGIRLQQLGLRRNLLALRTGRFRERRVGIGLAFAFLFRRQRRFGSCVGPLRCASRIESSGNGQWSDGSPVSASAVARITDDWTPCATTCLTTLHPAPVTFDMHFDGTLGPAWLAANAISGEHIEFTGSFHVADETLDFAWDGSQLTGTFCNGGPAPTCAPFTFASTALADGSLSFDDNLSFTGTVPGPGFTTELTLSAGWDSTRQPSTLAFLHTFGFDIVSSDPNLVWVSDAGQVTHVSVSAVPEPETLPLLSLGLLVLAPLARNRRRRG